ncbi:hypothetical protein P3T76_012342 [Phytophthora citrophthora]|uniref:RxLR effector protein n=1 Tax=Phytophthora citrophthora TaxID=4793 RepID=A0AAD9LD83_9STRA|nr:hypothetical protein P3T76_012342 [Phytophthora citrophthora]
MRLSQVLVIAAASFLFASDTVAVTTSNQAKISKMVQSSPSQRLLRSDKYLVLDEKDQSEDSVDVEERGFATPDEEDLEERSPLSNKVVNKLENIAAGWGTTYSSIVMGRSQVSDAKVAALKQLRDAYISGNKVDRLAAKLAVYRASR